MSCINKNLMEYQILRNRSGIPEETLDTYCRAFLA
jgi:hypothetical protein